jgi:hypothetical protein
MNHYNENEPNDAVRKSVLFLQETKQLNNEPNLLDCDGRMEFGYQTSTQCKLKGANFHHVKHYLYNLDHGPIQYRKHH